MAENLKGYTALITGGSSGLGFEMAKQLLSQEATVIIAARGGDKLNDAKERLSAFGDVHAVAMDVTDEGSVSDAASLVGFGFEHLDMVVCNAGIGRNAPGMDTVPEDHQFFDIPVSTFKAVIDTNFAGYFIVAKYFVPIMLKQGHGSLVYVSTSNATMTRAGQIPYGPSKAGAEAMSVILDEELKDLGIMVNVIGPGGFTDTGMALERDKEFRRRNDMPILQPTVLNRVISFLASPASAGIHGQKIIGKDFDEWLKEKDIVFEG
ncbi:MAG: SDR family oxidoreductase [Oscillospiraceae bacterium]|nr:SDR family oxidoreductase [Oscillospiraceae bacterium]